MTTKSDYSYKLKPAKWYQKPRPKKVLYKHSRKQVYNGKCYLKKDLPWYRPSCWYIEINMADYGAAIASTKTHKRNNKH
jgi:hypothetical protein